jgi:predicted component of type VI protein secretion system
MNATRTAIQTFVWVCVLAALCVAPAEAQTSIKDIVGNPGKYSDSEVKVVGSVSRHISSGGDETGTKNYMLQADSGQELRVRTTEEPPGIGNRVSVQGLVTISPINREPVVIEQVRQSVGSGSQNSDASSSADALREGFSTTTIFLIFGLGALVIAVLVYFGYASQEDSSQPASAPTNGTPSSEPSTESSLKDTELGADEEPSAGEPAPEQRIKSESSSSSQEGGDSSGPETLKFKAPPKTMKFIPGKLVVAAGPDQGKEFRIAGHPTPEGNVVTIGRAEVEGERAFAHIQLGDTYRTVSRMQAEIIQQDDTILLRNKSNTNPTMVNGEQVEAETTVELEDGDMIRMGEMMLRYDRD